jgi:hypothetical protein
VTTTRACPSSSRRGDGRASQGPQAIFWERVRSAYCEFGAAQEEGRGATATDAQFAITYSACIESTERSSAAARTRLQTMRTSVDDLNKAAMC